MKKNTKKATHIRSNYSEAKTIYTCRCGQYKSNFFVNSPFVCPYCNTKLNVKEELSW